MSFIIFELAAHPDCQQKLREEINKHCEKTGGKLTYEAVQDMPYLSACIQGKFSTPCFFIVLELFSSKA